MHDIKDNIDALFLNYNQQALETLLADIRQTVTGRVPEPVKSDVEYLHVDEGEPLKMECQHFLDCITNGQTPITDVTEALSVLRILDGVKSPSA